MTLQSSETEKLQWHPAFFAGLQIELKEDRDNLIFENEHQLGTKPKQIDVLVIKKEKDIPVKKNIGRIFRRHNIIEYKSPMDYLSIDNYYKGYAYAMFYKADTELENTIPIQDITLTFVSIGYPQKLIEHLEKEWGYRIEERFQGIYYIHKERDILPMQLIVTSRLSWEDNLWLRSLTNRLKDGNQIQRIVDEYKRNKSNKLYESVMDIIVKANYKEFKEAKAVMCKALEELMADVIEERVEERVEKRVEERVEKRVEERTKEVTDKAKAQGMAQGKAQELIASVDNVVKNLKLSLEQGCIAVGTTLEGYTKAQELLKEAKK